METETDHNNLKDITQSDLDLTEEELQKIFFGSSERGPIQEESDSNSKDDKISNTPKKLIRQNKKDIPSVIAPDLKKIISEPKQPPRPQGRPKIWTPEKIEQKKLENAKIAEQKRKEKADKIRLSKLSTQEPVTKYEREKIIDSVLKSKDEINEHITNKKIELKNILKKESFPFIRKSQSKCKHIYKLHSFMEGSVVTTCKFCSEIKQMKIDEWNLYLSRNRKNI